MKQPQQKFDSPDNFRAFRGAFAKAFPSSMPRQSQGSARLVVDLTDDDDHHTVEPAGNPRAQRSANTGIIDLTLSPSPQPGTPRLPSAEPASLQAATSRLPPNPAPSLPIIPKLPRSRSTATDSSQGINPHVRISPPSGGNNREATSQADYMLKTEKSPKSPWDHESEEEGIEEDDERSRDLGLRASPDTPSKQSSRGRLSSQKSIDQSIGSTSPLIRRLQASKKFGVNLASREPRRDESPREVMARRSMSTEKQQQGQHSTIAELEESLNGFKQTVLEQHAETVRWMLFDAKRAVEKTEPAFIDKVSPFASMKPVHAVLGELVPDGFFKVKMDSYINKKKLTKNPWQLITKKITCDVSSVPKYTSFTIVRRNLLCADDETLKFTPYLGEARSSSKTEAIHNRLLKELEEVHSAKRFVSTQESEWASKLRAYVDDWLQELRLSCYEQDLIRYIIEEDRAKDREISKRDLKVLRKKFGAPLAPSVRKEAKTLSQAFENVFDVSLKDVILPDERLKEMIDLAKKSLSSDQVTRSHSESPKIHDPQVEQTREPLGAFTKFTCLICGAIYCQTHGDYDRKFAHGEDSDTNKSDESNNSNDDTDDSDSNEPSARPLYEYQYTHKPLAMHHKDILRKRDARIALNPPELHLRGPSAGEKPCSDECHQTFDHYNDYQWTRENADALKSILVSIPYMENHPCDVSFLLDLPCWQVHREIEETKNADPRIPLEQVRSGSTKKLDWYDNESKTLKNGWRGMTDAHLHTQKGCQAKPCAHDGPCQRDCPCVVANILCESFCGCADDCPRRFTGCTCHSRGVACTSTKCICIQMNRECGPQCVSCGAVPRIDPRNKYDDDLFATGCQNVVLQRRVNPKSMIGESQLEGVGFGLYMGEPVRKGDYLGEYTGEVISSQEADRRGIIYDRKIVSFLFDLNKEWTIDAARLGSKTRFINHAEFEEDGLNCEAKIFLVNGEHRIKFVALRDIAVGEELLFNYGRKFAQKHGLTKTLPKAKKGGKKGVIDDADLDALDGVDERNRVTRGKMTAIRGGHGGGRGRKARKTAPIRQPVLPVEKVILEDNVEESDSIFDAQEDEEEEDYEEEEGDGEIGHLRKKRKITKPLRYTR